LPALTLKEIVDALYTMDPSWGKSITEKGRVPIMKSKTLPKGSGVPNLTGMGLKDAIYAIENKGYKCSYSGIGHVASQTPAPGTSAAKGSVIKIELK
jgi:beta-lactam-binding protein with PASTA domain